LDKVFFWVVATGIIITALTLISSVLMPFLVSGIMAYALHPAIDNLLLRYRLPRSITVLAISLLFFSIFTIIAIIVIPIIYQQLALLISEIPIYKNYLQTELLPNITTKIYSIDPNIADKFKTSMGNFINSIFFLITNLVDNIWHYTVVTVKLLVSTLLIPLALFYFLRDWSKMSNNITNLLPTKNKQKIQNIISSINDSLSAYLVGQLNVCLLLSIYYAISLSIIGVNFSLLLGVISGISVIIPFIGILISFSITMIISYFTLGMGGKLFYVMIIYFIGAISDSYILTPKIIGSKIGLHPLWVIFAVLALGNLFGFIGIFFAIPIAGIIKVLLSASIDSYKSSKFYNS